MNTSNLQEGKTYKNYKQLCEVLEVDPQAGNSKKSQLKEWKRYFKYTKQGHKFIVNEVYDNPLDKVENRGGTRNILPHANRMDTILTYLVRQRESNGKGELIVPINLLLRFMNMVNINYSYASMNREKTSKLLKIDSSIVEEFFDSSRQTFRNNVESMLNRLENKSLIFWNKELTVCVANAYNKINDYGDIKVDHEIVVDEYDNEEMQLNTYANINKETRAATSEEIELILKTEGNVMDMLECSNKQELIVKKKWNRFNKEVNKRLMEEANIMYYYDSYKIIRNMDRLDKEINNMEEEEINEAQFTIEQVLLNMDVQIQLLTNIEKRQERAWKKVADGSIINSRDRSRLSFEYMEQGNVMIDTFINMNHEDIRNEIKKTKVK
jgi:hypothetical protein